MVASTGGYYGAAFKGARGVTQGDPLSHTIFNVVVDVVVRHWVTVIVEGAEERAIVDKRVGIRMTSSTRTMAWLHCQTHNGSRVCLVPWSAFSVG